MRDMYKCSCMSVDAGGGTAELPEGAAGRYIESCYSALARRFDAALGGFGAAPKFPRPAEINLLLVEHLRVSQGLEAPSATTSKHGALHRSII